MFLNRKDAGQKLGLALEAYKNKNAMVVAIPRGGVEIGYYVAKHLDAELTVVITRKLGYPTNPEAAFGALAEDGSLYISQTAATLLTTPEMDEVIRREEDEIDRRIFILRRGRPLPDMEDRIVIIVDDGIATGATLFATLELCRKLKPDKIVVAAPIAGQAMERTLLQKHKVDHVVILESPLEYRAVSQAYETFIALTDEEASDFLKKRDQEWRMHHVL
jgi:putative phosphoribosyl transferase